MGAVAGEGPYCGGCELPLRSCSCPPRAPGPKRREGFDQQFAPDYVSPNVGKVRLRSDGRAAGTVVTITDREGRELGIKGVVAVRWEIKGPVGQRGRLVLEVDETECDLTLLPEDVVVIPKEKDIPF